MESDISTEQLISLVDTRGTWSWMLEPGSQGYGLVTWVSDPLYWDQIDQYRSIASQLFGKPIFTPAIVHWTSTQSPGATPLEHNEPWLECTIIIAFGTSEEFRYTGTVALNAADYWDESFTESIDLGMVRLPVWAVTPVDEEFAYEIAQHCDNYWGQYREVQEIPWLNMEHELHNMVEIDGEDVECPGENWEGPCVCDLEERLEALITNAENGFYFPFHRNDPDSLATKFFQTWDWGFDRYLKATALLHENNQKRDDTCLSSWVWSQSPFLVTAPSNEWMTITEPGLLTHLMSSQLSLDYSTAV